MKLKFTNHARPTCVECPKSSIHSLLHRQAVNFSASRHVTAVPPKIVSQVSPVLEIYHWKIRVVGRISDQNNSVSSSLRSTTEAQEELIKEFL